MHLARGKAAAVSPRFPNDVVLGADTVVAFGDLILGKPADAQHAASMIQTLAGHHASGDQRRGRGLRGNRI